MNTIYYLTKCGAPKFVGPCSA